MEALLIAARTEASEVVAIEKNSVAAECLRRAKRMLERNKTAICPGAGKVRIIPERSRASILLETQNYNLK